MRARWLPGRRRFLATSAALVPFPAVAFAQEARTRRLGFLSPTGRPGPAIATVLTTLRELGWVEGRNIAIEVRYADGNVARLPALADELIQRNVDVLMPLGPAPTRVVAQATRTVPIVIPGGIDPIAAGLVTSLARPGRNVTGVSSLAAETAAKRLEMLRQIAPRYRRVGVFWDPAEPEEEAEWQALQHAAGALLFELVPLRVAGPAEVAGADPAARVDALFNVGSLGPPRARAPAILELAAARRIPAVFGWPGLIEDGGLLSYNIDFEDTLRRAAMHIHSILNGAKPADLPIEQPRKFELVINLRTAKAHGLTVPRDLLVRADRTIQ